MAMYHLTISASKRGSLNEFSMDMDVPDPVVKFFSNSNYRNEVSQWLENNVPLDKKKHYDEFRLVTFSKKR